MEKFKELTVTNDRLTMAQQMASGVIATRTINTIVNQMEKGLR
jgi:hypothetical protein